MALVFPVVRILTTTTHYPAANTAAIATVGAVASERHVLRTLEWSYSAAPTAGKLTVTDGGTTKIDIDITSAGPGALSPELPMGVNGELVVTLAAGGGAVVGKLQVHTYRIQST